MSEYRSRWARQQAADAAKRADGLTDEQHKAMMTEFDRRIMTFKKKWLRCPDRHCRRRQQCLGPPLTCNRVSWDTRWPRRLYKRLRRDVVRAGRRRLRARNDAQSDRNGGFHVSHHPL